MVRALNEFFADEDGAVTVDWVVLTASVAFIATLIIGNIQTATTDVSDGTGARIPKHGLETLK